MWDFPGGSDRKVSAYNAEDLGSIPGSGRSPSHLHIISIKQILSFELLRLRFLPNFKVIAKFSTKTLQPVYVPTRNMCDSLFLHILALAAYKV